MALPMAKTGSVMMCDKGTAPVPLVASGSATVKICDVFLAAVSDVKPGANISPFGTCIITQSVCSPTPVGFWKNPFDNACIVGGVQSLLENAELPCAIGGKISLMSAGQASVLVGKNLTKIEPPVCTTDDEGSEQGSHGLQFLSGLYHSRDVGALRDANGQFKDDALAFVNRFYPNADEWLRNAARHGYWMGALSLKHGEGSATAVGKAHERHGAGTPTDHWVDNYNNIVARKIARGRSPSEIPNTVRTHISRGSFITDPEDKRIPPELRCRRKR